VTDENVAVAGNLAGWSKGLLCMGCVVAEVSVGETAGHAAPPSDRDALMALFYAQYGRLVRLVQVVNAVDDSDAREAVHDAFVKVFARPRVLRDASTAEAYLRSAVLNAARTRAGRNTRRRSHETPTAPADMTEPGTASAEPDDVARLLSSLPRRQREVVAARLVLDLSEQQTADLLGLSQGSVKSYLHKALAALRLEAGGEPT